ncbi:hypothetical protein KAJ27_03825, partial [bacterium]|nr:hypothetical protein [bacterium]
INLPKNLSEKLYEKGKFHNLLDTIGFTLVCIALLCMITVIVAPDVDMFRFNLSNFQQDTVLEENIYSQESISIDIVKIPIKLGIWVTMIAMLISVPFVYLKDRKLFLV